MYNPLISKGAKFFTTSRRAAELIKYASNAFLATKITFINELSNLCEKSGIDIDLKKTADFCAGTFGNQGSIVVFHLRSGFFLFDPK